MRRAAFLLLFAAVVSSGCGASGSKQSAMQQNLGSGDDSPNMTALELRLRVYEASAMAAGRIELAADEILAVSQDPGIRRRAILWKISAAPAIQRAAFQPDPLAAMADTWALVIQMRNYLSDGAGRALFGAHQPIATTAARDLDAEFSRRMSGVVGEEARARFESHVRTWADSNPMESAFTRPSAVQELAPIMASERVGGLAAVTSLNDQMIDLSTRMAIWAEMIPRQARWQADLVAEDLARGPAGEHLVERVGDEGRAVLRDELDHFLVQAESMAVADVRIALAGLEEERERIRQELIVERGVLLAAIETEREAILAAVREERILTLEQAEGIANRLVDRTNTPIRDAIDHLILRLAQLLAAAAFVIALTIVVLRRRGAPRQA